MMLESLIEFLKKDSFQDPEAGLLSFPAYVYTYNPAKEYQMREELKTLKKRLDRPKSWQECLILNIYDELIEYLKGRKLGNESMWELILEKEAEDPQKARKDLSRHTHSDEFRDFVNTKIVEHLEFESDKNKSYVVIHGWGSIFPFLRAHTFLNKMEDKIIHYKMILLYPGKYKDGQYIMFNKLQSDKIYRGSCLNQLIGE